MKTVGSASPTAGAREQQINARIASLRSELQQAANASAGASASDNEQLAEDLRRRQESYIRRERQYEQQIRALRDEVEQLKQGRSDWMEQDEKVRNIRDMHKQLMKNVSTVQENTARVLKDQEKDLLRAFRARLFDIQSELEIEKNKVDVGASAWIEKNRQLERGLDWAKEMADRLERVNQALQQENTKLKSQYKTQENDREFLIRQLVAVKKDNVQLRQEIENKDDLIEKQREEIEQLAVFKKQSMRSTTTQNVPGSTRGTLPPANRGAHDGRAGGMSSESEVRYKEIIKRLKKLLDTERANLKKVRKSYSEDLKIRTELEILLRDCVLDVRRNIAKQRQLAAMQPSASAASLHQTPSTNSEPEDSTFEAKELFEQEREQVLELLLSQERVVTLLYKKTFPTSKAIPSASSADLRPGGVGLSKEEAAEIEDEREALNKAAAAAAAAGGAGSGLGELPGIVSSARSKADGSSDTSDSRRASKK